MEDGIICFYVMCLVSVCYDIDSTLVMLRCLLILMNRLIYYFMRSVETPGLDKEEIGTKENSAVISPFPLDRVYVDLALGVVMLSYVEAMLFSYFDAKSMFLFIYLADNFNPK